MAQLQATAQEPADYRVPKGLHVRGEIARSWRIAQACFQEMEAGRASGGDAFALAERFLEGFLRHAFCFASVRRVEPRKIGERMYPVRFFALGDRVPVVVAPVGAGLDTPLRELGDDRRRRSAFGLLQETLNASGAALWGLAADGLSLRIARNNVSLTRPAWIEADLGRIFMEDLYPDFAALWLLAHESRFGRVDAPAKTCPLELWREASRQEGTRARDKLSAGFRQALEILGQGFLSHAANSKASFCSARRESHEGSLLRTAPATRLPVHLSAHGRRTGSAAPDERTRYRPPALCRWICPLPPSRSGPSAGARSITKWISGRPSGSSSGALQLGNRRSDSPPSPACSRRRNAPTSTRRSWRTAHSWALSSIWLGFANPRGSFALTGATWARMSSATSTRVFSSWSLRSPGTDVPSPLRAPMKAGAMQGRQPAATTRRTSWCSSSSRAPSILWSTARSPLTPSVPSMPFSRWRSSTPPAGRGTSCSRRPAGSPITSLGSGAGSTPTPADYQRALRDVVRRCIYGVDMNPLAVEICKVSLWMESIDPGLPLTFLESHIRCGNSLIGTSRALMGERVPEAAWAVLEGDDKKVTRSLRRRNQEEIAGRRRLPFEPRNETGALRAAMRGVEQAPDTDAAAMAEKKRKWKILLASPAYEHEKLVADAWCAAFLWPKDDPGSVVEAAPTTATWLALRDKDALPSPVLVDTTRRIAEDYGFFHWELTFPHIFSRGGFAVVLGNPPWERVKLQEQEFFAKREPSIAKARNAAERKKLIAALPTTNPVLWIEWTGAMRVAQGQSHFVRGSGRYPICGKGDVNTYALFAEHNLQLPGPRGRAGFIVPSGIATDHTTKDYFQAIMKSRALQSMWEFENEGFFTAGKGHMLRFALTTLSGRSDPATADFLFQGQAITDLDDPERHFSLSAAEIETINPNTGTCPIFRTKRDAAIALAIYRRAGVLWRESDPDGNPWGLRFLSMFHMTNDSGLFRTQADLASAGWRLEAGRFERNRKVMSPLYEAKMTYRYNHRSGTFEGAPAGKRPHRLSSPSHGRLADPKYATMPFYWVAEEEVDARLDGVWNRGWLLGWRNVTDSRASARTIVACFTPRAAVGNSFPLMMPSLDPRLVASLYANLSSIPFDYCARQKIAGLNLNYFAMRQLPGLCPGTYATSAPWAPSMKIRDWLLPRVLELTYTAWDLRAFAEDCGDDGPPFIWDPERRFQLQCEIDAAFFLLYGISRDDTAYILDTFPVLERSEEGQHGEYRTKRAVLETYDALAGAAAKGTRYDSPLGPPRRAK